MLRKTYLTAWTWSLIRFVRKEEVSFGSQLGVLFTLTDSTVFQLPDHHR